MAAIYADLQRQANEWLADEGVPPARRRLSRLADLRYRHQGFEITVPWTERDVAIDPLIARFHAAHERLYTYALPDAPVEIVTLRLAASGRVRRFALPEGGESRVTRRRTTRAVYFAGHGWIQCPCLDRDTLGRGSRVDGPAIVEQPDSTTVVLPGQRARADRFGTLVIGERAPR
jgi:N-methylhydantoinase A